MKRATWFGLCLLCACSSGKNFVPAAPGDRDLVDSGPPDGSTTSSGGKGGKGGAGGGGGSGGGSNVDAGPDAGGDTMDALAPTISFTAPMVADSPDSANVIVEPSVRVRCKATQSTMTGSSQVDKSSVKIVLQDTHDATKTISSTVAAVDDDEFEAVFDVSAQNNGTLKFTCTAKDQTTHTGSGSMTTLLDFGPTINLSDPKDKGIYALKSPFKIKFTVASSPIGPSDSKAAVKSVKLTIGGVETPVSEPKDTPGEYQTSIDFTDKTKFPVAPTSAQIQVFATDGRKPTAATRRVQADVTIDGEGPKITVMSPPNFTIQHGSVPLVVSVTDPSGIMAGTLIATINTVPYMSWKASGDTYTQTFDTRDIDKDNVLTQLTINLTAIDNVGNKTDPPVSHTLRLDNLPPVISLDPPPLKEVKTTGNMLTCSQPYDPVGRWAVNDLQDPVLSSAYFRVLVEDHTNHSPGAQFNYLAGTNPAQVVMYTQGLSEVPLLIDTNGDHICDEIYNNENDTVHDKLPDEKLPVKINLAAVNGTGDAWFAKKGLAGTVDDPSCPNLDGNADHPPDTVCDNSEMYRVIPALRIQGKPAAVYSFNPSNNGSTGECTGAAWEILGNTRGREGWICVAARAEDNIGNVGVSAPLRLCFDGSNTNNGTTPKCTGTPPPTCTDGCTVSDAQRFPTGMIWSDD